MNLSKLSGMVYSTPTSSQDKVLQYFKEKEELEYDPVYLIAAIANIALLNLSLQSTKTNGPIKMSFTQDRNGHSYIQIEAPGFYQKINRFWGQTSREDLNIIRPHLIKYLRWFDYQQEPYRTILKECQKGLDILREGYARGGENETLTIKDGLNSTIQIHTGISKFGFVIRVLRMESELIQEALDAKEGETNEKFKQKLDKEEKNYFPLHQLHLQTCENKTIDQYLQTKIKAKWENQTQLAIMTLLKPGPQNTLAHYNSLNQLIDKSPESHTELKKEVQARLKEQLEKSEIIS